MKRTVVRLACAVLAVAAAAPAQAGVITLYFDLTSFTTAIGGAPLIAQDFEGIAPGTNMSGVEFLPGVSATTNMTSLTIFSSSGDNVLFGSGRDAGTAFYDIALAVPYTSIAFDIDGFEAVPGDGTTASGPGVLTVFLADATSVDFSIAGNLTGAPIFVGIVADPTITGIRWAEALEGGGGNEETALDNFQVVPVVPVPEPASLLLLGTGLAGWLGARRRMRRN